METTNIPLQYVGPIYIHGTAESFEVDVPLATYETPLWPSVARGAAVTKRSGGISTTIVNDGMSRSIVLEASSAKNAMAIQTFCSEHQEELLATIYSSSRYLRNATLNFRIVGSLFFLRIHALTGDASGHNMITQAADLVISWICSRFPEVQYVSVSGNYCTDKKTSSVNAILGRGKYVIAEACISDIYCRKYLSTTPQAICDLNIKKNFLGSIINGGVQSANTHFANMLLALYLATGQDGANIVEGSQGITYCEVRESALYFSVSIPNIIVGTCGNGKDQLSAQKALRHLGCLEERPYGENSRRLAQIIAAAVLCGELSCMAAQTNPGELIRTHIHLERDSTKTKRIIPCKSE